MPASVLMDSGWNCTPSTFNVLCRTPMISPSVVCAVICNSLGNESVCAISE